MILQLEQEKVKLLVKNIVDGDYDAFGELERIAKPLLCHLADYYSGLHIKFEYDDFYSICLNALFEACLKYNPKNPSFLSYAKKFMVNQCNRELKHWNAEMRNIFVIKEVMIGLEREVNTNDTLIDFITVEDEAIKNEFRNNLTSIMSLIFDSKKEEVMRLYVFYNLSPKDISDITGLKYQNTYSIIRRGMVKIAKEYKNRYTLDIIRTL